MLERLDAYKNLGFETPKHSKFHHYASIPFAEILLKVSRAEINGTLPNEGPAIVVANHVSLKDAFLLHLIAILQAQRTISVFANRSRLEKGVSESEEAKAGRTQEDVGGIRRSFLRWYLNGFNPIPVDIGGTTPESRRVNMAAFKRATEELKAGRLVGIFPQGHRKPDRDLLDMMEGITTLVKMNPDVPIYPVGFSGTDKGLVGKIKINIGEPFTYRDIPAIYRSSRVKTDERSRIIELIADRIAEQIEDPALKSAWRLKKLGWTKEEVEDSHTQYPALDETAGLIDVMTRFDPGLANLSYQEMKKVLLDADRASASLID